MATVDDVEVANASFPNVRQDLNDILEALATNFSADAEPTTTYPNQFWYETDSNLLYIRNEADDAWITLASINQTSGEWEPRTAVIQAVDSAGVVIKTDDGTTRLTIADDGSVTINTSLDVDNIKIDGNTISSTDTNGDINITPDGTGKVVLDGLNYPTADGTDGQVLTTDGSGNIAFEDAGGAGKVLQVVTNSTTTFASTASSTYANLGDLDTSITPTSASSTILILLSVPVTGDTDNDSSDCFGQFKIIATSGGDRDVFESASERLSKGGQGRFWSWAPFVEDSPSTTSAVSYRFFYKRPSGNVSLRVNSSQTATMVLMEIAG